MPHTKDWGSTNPGCLIFLVDQSASMADEYQEGSAAAGQTLKRAVATQINNVIKTLGDKCLRDTVVSPRVDIGIIGYGADSAAVAFDGNLAGRELVSITELMDNPLRLETRELKDTKVDDAGNFREVVNQIEFPVWVEEVANLGTPMNSAVELAGQIASEWVKDHMECHPPVVVNITDGVYTDADPRPMAEYLKQLATNDGSLLMFNCHMSVLPGSEFSYPLPADPLPHDEWESAPILFDMSSEVPEKMRSTAAAMGLEIAPGARGFLFNSDLRSLADMIVWASQGGVRNPDQ